MRKQGSGKIINISSVAGRIGFPASPAYISSKFALEGLSECLRLEMAPFGVDVVIIEPGVIKTNFLNPVKLAKKSESDTAYSDITTKVVSGVKMMAEMGTPPKEVADAVVKSIKDALNNVIKKVGEKIADQKEFWHHGPVIDDSFDKKIPQNLNIEQVPQFNSNFDELYNELHKIGSRVLSVIALSLGLDSDYFSPWVEKGNSLLRSIHYPPVESLSNPHRARAHEDINLITLSDNKEFIITDFLFNFIFYKSNAKIILISTLTLNIF